MELPKEELGSREEKYPRVTTLRTELGLGLISHNFKPACGQPGECTGVELPVQDLLQIAPSQQNSPAKFNSVP